MTQEIEMLESYKFYGTTLMGGARYKTGQMVGGFELNAERVKTLIEEGWAREVA